MGFSGEGGHGEAGIAVKCFRRPADAEGPLSPSSGKTPMIARASVQRPGLRGPSGFKARSAVQDWGFVFCVCLFRAQAVRAAALTQRPETPAVPDAPQDVPWPGLPIG